MKPIVFPTVTLGLTGDTVMLDKVGAGVTHVRVVLPLIAPTAALIVEEPAETHVAISGLATGDLTVATPVELEVQVAERVRSCLELSEYVPVAMKPMVLPTFTLGVAGVTEMLTSVGTGF